MSQPPRHPRPGPDRHSGAGGQSAPGHDPLQADEAIARLEDVLLALPYDRALPDLPTILERAEVPRELLHVDDRAAKILHEAIVARPLASVDAVARRRTEVELLTLEVGVLSERLADATTSEDEVARSSARLRAIRERLEALAEEL